MQKGEINEKDVTAKVKSKEEEKTRIQKENVNERRERRY